MIQRLPVIIWLLVLINFRNSSTNFEISGKIICSQLPWRHLGFAKKEISPGRWEKRQLKEKTLELQLKVIYRFLYFFISLPLIPIHPLPFPFTISIPQTSNWVYVMVLEECADQRLLCADQRLLCADQRLLSADQRLLCADQRLLCADQALSVSTLPFLPRVFRWPLSSSIIFD